MKKGDKKIWITSDNHFGHANIIEYCNRPFMSITEMNYVMIKNWNDVVKPDDIIYHLGDFAFYSKIDVKHLLSKLNGYKILILGNHDKKKRNDSIEKRIEFMKNLGFNEVYKILHIDNFLLVHIPIRLKNVLSLNVGVDVHNFFPIPFPTTKQRMVLCGHVHDKWMYKC